MIGVIAQGVEDGKWSGGGNTQHSVCHNEDGCSVTNTLHLFGECNQSKTQKCLVFLLLF